MQCKKNVRENKHVDGICYESYLIELKVNKVLKSDVFINEYKYIFDIYIQLSSKINLINNIKKRIRSSKAETKYNVNIYGIYLGEWHCLHFEELGMKPLPNQEYVIAMTILLYKIIKDIYPNYTFSKNYPSYEYNYFRITEKEEKKEKKEQILNDW